MAKADAFKKDINSKANPELHKIWNQPRTVRAPYEPYKSVLDCSKDPGVCDPSQAAELDVNYIIKKAQQTGILPGIDAKRVYGDFSNPLDYQESLNIIMKAEEQFMGLDAELRAKLDNDPAKFLEFVSDPKNKDQMVKYGLIEPSVDPTPQPADPVPAPAQPAALEPKA